MRTLIIFDIFVSPFVYMVLADETPIKRSSSNQCEFMVTKTEKSSEKSNTLIVHSILTAEPSHRSFFELGCITDWFFAFNHSIYGYQERILNEDQLLMVPLSSITNAAYNQKNQPSYLSFVHVFRLSNTTWEVTNELKLTSAELPASRSGLYILRGKHVDSESYDHLATFELVVQSKQVTLETMVLDSMMQSVNPAFLQVGQRYAFVCQGIDSPELPNVRLESEMNATGIEAKDGTFDKTEMLWFAAIEPVYKFACFASKRSCNNDTDEICNAIARVQLYTTDIENATEYNGMLFLFDGKYVNDNDTIQLSSSTADFFHNLTCIVQRYIYNENITMQGMLKNGAIIKPDQLFFENTTYSNNVTWRSIRESATYSCSAHRVMDGGETKRVTRMISIEILHEQKSSWLSLIVCFILVAVLFVVSAIAFCQYRRHNATKSYYAKVKIHEPLDDNKI